MGRWTIAAALLALVHLALGWPGVAPYDAVTQYAQALSGRFDDWHPPLMAWAWRALLPLGPGAAPLLVAQLGFYWLGLGLIAAALAAAGRPRAGGVVLGFGALPLFSGWEIVVVKDALMAACLVAAVGLAGWWRLRARPVPPLGVLMIALLLGVATLLRANALFASLPLALLLWRAKPIARFALGLGGGAALIALVPLVNQRLLGAEPSHVWRTLPIYDLAGMAARGAPVLSAGEARLLRPGCVSAYFWDPLGDPAHCGAFAARLEALPPRALVSRWAIGAARHPRAYAAHRLAHWNVTERLWVGRDLFGAAPPAASEPNALGLGSPGPAARVWQRLARVQGESPLGWPALFSLAALLVAIAAARRPAAPARDLALALAGSALALEASFALVSIAADLRYHLWPMLATGVALVLIVPQLAPRTLSVGAALLLALALVAMVARVVLPPAPESYRAMLGGALRFS
ncbi:MAG: hypothetical protein K2X76_04420 [Sphingomonas sp.]|nr:hypothetical protein [Sphingomonas sp.]